MRVDLERTANCKLVETFFVVQGQRRKSIDWRQLSFTAGRLFKGQWQCEKHSL